MNSVEVWMEDACCCRRVGDVHFSSTLCTHSSRVCLKEDEWFAYISTHRPVPSVHWVEQWCRLMLCMEWSQPSRCLSLFLLWARVSGWKATVFQVFWKWFAPSRLTSHPDVCAAFAYEITVEEWTDHPNVWREYFPPIGHTLEPTTTTTIHGCSIWRVYLLCRLISQPPSVPSWMDTFVTQIQSIAPCSCVSHEELLETPLEFVLHPESSGLAHLWNLSLLHFAHTLGVASSSSVCDANSSSSSSSAVDWVNWDASSLVVFQKCYQMAECVDALALEDVLAQRYKQNAPDVQRKSSVVHDDGNNNFPKVSSAFVLRILDICSSTLLCVENLNSQRPQRPILTLGMWTLLFLVFQNHHHRKEMILERCQRHEHWIAAGLHFLTSPTKPSSLPSDPMLAHALIRWETLMLSELHEWMDVLSFGLLQWSLCWSLVRDTANHSFGVHSPSSSSSSSFPVERCLPEEEEWSAFEEQEEAFKANDSSKEEEEKKNQSVVLEFRNARTHPTHLVFSSKWPGFLCAVPIRHSYKSFLVQTILAWSQNETWTRRAFDWCNTTVLQYLKTHRTKELWNGFDKKNYRNPNPFQMQPHLVRAQVSTRTYDVFPFLFLPFSTRKELVLVCSKQARPSTFVFWNWNDRAYVRENPFAHEVFFPPMVPMEDEKEHESKQLEFSTRSSEDETAAAEEQTFYREEEEEEFALQTEEEEEEEFALQTEEEEEEVIFWIDRTCLLQSTLDVVTSNTFLKHVYRHTWSIQFRGEDAMGDGVVREWLTLTTEEMLQQGWVQPCQEGNSHYVLPSRTNTPAQQRCIGRIFLLAWVWNMHVSWTFAPHFFQRWFRIIHQSKQLQQQSETIPIRVTPTQLTLRDLQFVDEGLAKQFQELPKYFDDPEKTMGLTFQWKDEELFPNGAHAYVDQSNVKLFVHLCVYRVLWHDSFEHVLCGLLDMQSSIPILTCLMRPRDFEFKPHVAISSLMEWWEQRMQYTRPFSVEHPTVRAFWKFVKESSPEMQMQLVRFVSGSTCWNFSLYPLLSPLVHDQWPRAFACFSELQIPQDATSERLHALFSKIFDLQGSSTFAYL